ncbi:VOC family protein [Streptomyces sp. NPDC004959]|uniref:VOC family protein n=1 Tax=unclassified Streptomyces TaxID=2593676 RepID=UPI0004C9C04E|nr:VOC family protein [Streptomyces sp. NRRL F-5630]
MKIANVPSAPCWADLTTPDTAAARRFYRSVLGWEGSELPGGDAQGYGLFALDDGRSVGGFVPTARPDRPAAWLPYFQAEGVDAVTARVEGAGGTVTAGPSDMLDQGRYAVCADPAGAVFGLWQRRAHPGFGVVNAVGGFCWFELASRDPAVPTDFYATVLGWATTSPDENGYRMWTVDDEPFGGLLRMNDSFPAHVPPHWTVYVATEDCDATAARCAKAGGTVLVPPRTIASGRFTVLSDPQGAVFGALALNPLSGLAELA